MSPVGCGAMGAVDGGCGAAALGAAAAGFCLRSHASIARSFSVGLGG